ncbi:MAG: hypothetical protein ACLURG_03620 [Gemmiger sp.]
MLNYRVERADPHTLLKALQTLEARTPSCVNWRDDLGEVHVQLMGSAAGNLQTILQERFGLTVRSARAAFCIRRR